MTTTPHPEERSGDYSYDLAHEDVEGAHDEADRSTHSAQVSTATPEYAEGDYSYDLAHDIPPQDA